MTKLIPAILLVITTWVAPAFGQLSDSEIHPPPSSGPYAYNTFTPKSSNFPGVGGSYIDPVFGSPVTRLTNYTGTVNQDDIYAHHWSNADGTLAFTRNTSMNIVDVATGEVRYSRQPVGLKHYENYWDAIDPDSYYYLSGRNLMKRTLSTQTDTIVKTFPSELQVNGGSLNVQTRDGRYFTVRYDGTNKVWDSQTDTIYAGSVTPVSSTGWVSITPDGKYLVSAGQKKYSYEIDHQQQRISSTSAMFWDLCGDHGVLVSAGNGKNYFVGFECTDVGAVYRIDISLDQTGRTPSSQRADNQLLVDLEWTDDGHMSAVSRGPLSDWVFIGVEDYGTDSFDSSTANWTLYKQEILAVNVLSGVIQRLAHHRSRNLRSSYGYQPRVSCSWDGSTVMWASNFNVGDPSGYADLYAIRFPFESAPLRKPTPPTDLQ